MKEDFVTFEISKKLYNLGFKEPCLFAFAEGSSDVLPNRKVAKREGESISVQDLYQSGYSFYVARCDAPTISQVLKWLREEKNLHIEIWYNTQYTAKKLKGFQFVVTPICENPQCETDLELYCDYETAAIKGIEYVLDNMIIV